MKFKVLTATLPAGTNTHTFNSNLIGNDTIIDVYTTDDDVLVLDQEQSGQNVTVTIDNHTESVGVALVVNNITEAEYPIYTDNIIYDNQGFTVPLNDVIEQIESSARNAGVRAEGALSEITNTINPHLSTLDNSVEGLNQSFIQLYADGYASKNKIKAFKIGRWISSSGTESADATGAISEPIEVESNTDYTFSVDKGTTNLNNIGACWYTENMTFIERNLRTLDAQQYHTIKAPSNAKYLVAITSNSTGAMTEAEIEQVNPNVVEGTEADRSVITLSNTDLTQSVDELNKSFTQLSTYSISDEVVIGQDESGRKIYRKVVSVTTTTGSTNTGIAITNIRTLYRLNGTCKQSNGQIISAPYYYADSNNVLYFLGAANILQIVGSGSAVIDALHTIVIEYSKN